MLETEPDATLGNADGTHLDMTKTSGQAVAHRKV